MILRYDLENNKTLFIEVKFTRESPSSYHSDILSTFQIVESFTKDSEGKLVEVNLKMPDEVTEEWILSHCIEEY